MRKNQSSMTALGIAVMRAVESDKPAEARMCYDPLARLFIPGWMYHILGFFIRSGYTEWRGPGVQGFLAARERFIDDELLDALAQGLRQLVILGAGFDSRAYRLDLSGVAKIFEVDHPATQREKQARLRRIFGDLPKQVAYVAIDFNTQTLEECLLAEGYDPGLKTFFIWQGVSMYLDLAAVDATLAFVRGHSTPGSAIVFDYIYREALEGAQSHSEVGNMRRYRFMTGEGLTFGIPEGGIKGFLKARGFRETRDINAEGLRQRYCVGPNAGRRIAGGYGIATGVV